MLMLTGCSGSTNVVPHFPVTKAQQAALTHYYLQRLWFPDGFARVGCPVAILGAARIGQRLRVYAVVHCTSVTAQCAVGTDYTDGLAADLVGTEVVGVKRDNADDYNGMIAEGDIYPPALRSTALNYINYGGPAWLRKLAARVAGCPKGVH
jgi:hypothetical protein